MNVDLLKNSLSHQHDQLMISTKAFGIIREKLVFELGEERTQKFLYSLGKNIGKEIATSIKTSGRFELEELVKASEYIHKSTGQVSAVEMNGKIIFEESGKAICHNTLGKWFDSFEANLHMKHSGISKHPICFILSGFASGYLETVYDYPFFVKELTCKAQGHSYCTFQIMKFDDCSDEDKFLQQELTIQKELKENYDMLLNQRNILDTASKLQHTLTKLLMNGESLDKILKYASEILDTPILIQNNQGHIISYSLLSKEELDFYYLVSNKKTIKSKNDTIKIKNIHHSNGSELMIPLILDNKRAGTCSFLYFNNKKPKEHDKVYLERIAMVANLCLLKQKTIIETQYRLKNSLLDQILYTKSNTQNFESSLLMYEENFVSPFQILLFRLTSENEINFFKLQNKLSLAFDLYNLPKLISVYEGNFICLIPSRNLKELRTILQKILNEMKPFSFKIGISDELNDIEKFHTYLEQAKLSSMIPRKSNIIYFNELGFLGSLITEGNKTALKKNAYSMLKSLVEPTSKSKELLYTLYRYLQNGQKLEAAMKDLNLSIGGVHYRIQKIEKILQLDLKDSSVASYLLLSIEALLLLEEISFDDI